MSDGRTPSVSPFKFLRRHKHIWWVNAIQVEHYTHGDFTNILHKCECGKVKVETIKGGWTASSLGLTLKRDE